MSSETDDGFLDDPDAMFTSLWVVVGVLLLFVGRQIYGALLAGGLAGVVLVTQLYATGVAVILAATIPQVDLRRWCYPVAAWVTYTLLAVGIYNFMLMPTSPGPIFFASDVSLFESWSAHLIATGRNPMSANMLASHEAWDVSNQSANITATAGGGVVTNYSYPGGTLWLSTLEQILLPVKRLGVANLLAATAFLAWMLKRVDTGLVPVVLLTWLAPTNRVVSASMGMITPFWLFPLAVGLAAWYDERLDVAAIGLGIAIASKQLAWPIAGLVLIHVLRTYGRRRAARLAGVSGAVAGILVAPFLLWNAEMWAFSAFSVFLPFGPKLVAQGVGLTSFTVGGVFTVPRSVHLALTLLVAGGFVAGTWLYPQRMKWAIPFAMIVTLMFHYRTLPSYYAATLPLAIVALDARLRDRQVDDEQLLDRVFGDRRVIPT